MTSRTDDVLSALNCLWPTPVNDSVGARQLSYSAYMRAYVAVYNANSTDPSTCASTCLMFEAFIPEWASSARTFIGNDVHRYLSAWDALESGLRMTRRMFSYPDRFQSPQTQGDAKLLPEEQAIPTTPAALRQWRLKVTSPLLGEHGTMRSANTLPEEGTERQKARAAIRSSLETCGLTNINSEMTMLLD